MIITKQKSIKSILGFLKDSKNIYIVGCAQCATICKTGGEKEVSDIAGVLKKKGKIITGTAILDPACHLVKVKQFFYKNKKALSKSDALLVMACGNGTQVIIDGTKGMRAYTGLDTLFLGEIERGGHFSQKCVLCGECILDRTEGVCPITICAKGLLNGPCGGSKNGKCEIDKDRDCGWILIYNRLKDNGNLDKMKKIVEPQDYSKQIKPQKIVVSG